MGSLPIPSLGGPRLQHMVMETFFCSLGCRCLLSVFGDTLVVLEGPAFQMPWMHHPFICCAPTCHADGSAGRCFRPFRAQIVVKQHINRSLFVYPSSRAQLQWRGSHWAEYKQGRVPEPCTSSPFPNSPIEGGGQESRLPPSAVFCLHKDWEAHKLWPDAGLRPNRM